MNYKKIFEKYVFFEKNKNAPEKNQGHRADNKIKTILKPDP